MRIVILALLLQFAIPVAEAQNVPAKIPRRSSTQLLDGFGVNVNLPRRPRSHRHRRIPLTLKIACGRWQRPVRA